MIFLWFSERCHGNKCNLNVIVVLEFISRDINLLSAIRFSSKYQNSAFYQHVRPKSGLKFPRPLAYMLSSCAGHTSTYGRLASGFVVEPLDGNSQFQLHTLVECNDGPSSRDEIPTPKVAACYPDLQAITNQIPSLSQADILLLIGRDLPEAQHVLDQRIGPMNTPFAQRLHLSWIVVGEACLGKVHIP